MMPRILKNGEKSFYSVGKGSSGQFSYMESSTGRLCEMHIVRVYETGPFFSLGQFESYRLPAVRIDKSAYTFTESLNEGMRLIVGDISFTNGLPTARHAWLYNEAGLRQSGIIDYVDQYACYGFIRRATARDTNVFIHCSELADRKLWVGRSVTFKPVVIEGKGTQAQEVIALD